MATDNSSINAGQSLGVRGNYTHIPLKDPVNQFRLLRITNTDEDVDGPIDGELAIHDIASSPAYNAISYCWGDPTASEVVWLGSSALAVNRNCWHALWQVRHYAAAGRLYWIDSICINQSDVAEKSAQVARMSAIYQNATRVCACFGSEGDDSGFLFHALRSLRSGDSVQSASSVLPEPTQLVEDEVQRRTVNWLVELGSDFPRFAAAFRAFSRRPFFSRMWILQEMFLASNVVMLCGDEWANIQPLKEIELVCSFLLLCYRPAQEYDYKDAQVELLALLSDNSLTMHGDGRRDLGCFHVFLQQIHDVRRKSKMRNFGSPTEGIVQVQGLIRPLLCYDARDKIFGAISMFGSTCTIVPDYTITNYQLGIRVLEEFSRFGDDHRCVELADMLCSNLMLEPNITEAAGAMAKLVACDHCESPRVRAEGLDEDEKPQLLKEGTPWACRITTADSGRLTAPFKSGWSQNLDAPNEPAALTTSEWKSIDVNGRAVAIVSNASAAGDWIVPLGHYVTSYYRNYRLGLVVRLRNGNVYDVVGEAAFYPACHPCVSWQNCACQFGADFHEDYGTSFGLRFDCEELLLLAIRLKATFTLLQQDGFEYYGCDPVLPNDPVPHWKYSYAVRHDSTESIVEPFKPRVRKAQ